MKRRLTKQSHTNRIIQIVPRKTALIQLEKDLYRRIHKRNLYRRSVVTEDKICMVFLCRQRYLARLNLEKAIFKAENETMYSTNDHL